MLKTKIYGVLLCCWLAMGTTCVVTQAAEVPASTPQATDETPLLLRFQPVLNSKYSTQFDFSQGMTGIASKTKFEFRQTISALYDTRVMETNKNGATLLIYFRVLRSVVSNEKVEFSFDTSRAEPKALKLLKPQKNKPALSDVQDVYSPVMAALVKQTVTCKVSSQGKLIEVKGIDGILNRITEKPAMPKSFVESVYRPVTEDLVRRVVSGVNDQTLLYGVYADRPVHSGDTWNATQTFPGKASQLQRETSFNLQARANGISTVAVNGQVYQPVESSRVSKKVPSGDSPSIQLQGTVQVDEATGRVLSVSIQQRSYSRESNDPVSPFSNSTTYGKGSLTVKILNH